MSTKETELTFIRCPNCRSLVPAVATRCRMCGHSFEEAPPAAPDSKNGQGKSRVRQRTVSVGGQEVEKIKQELEQGAAPEESDSQASTKEDQPKKGGVGGLFSKGPKESLNFRSEKSRKGDTQVIDTPQFQEPQSSSSLFGGAPAPEKTTDSFEPVSKSSKPEKTSSSSFEPSFEDLLNEAPSKKASSKKSKSASEEVKEENVSKQKSAQPVEEQEQKSASNKKRKRRRKNTKNSGSSVEKENTMERAGAKSSQREDRERGNGPAKTRKSTPAPKREESSQVEIASSGALVGWFINYEEDPKGVAKEIRSGRYFIGQQRLRDSDLVFSDDSISTPHCLMKAAGDGVLLVQDLMSEGGTFVRRQDGETETIESEATEVYHGDTLVLGTYEVIICLVPVSN